ncbi:MAG TPA: S4 domain-containing protein, partial [Xanthomonadales bacterium]|nr:S4 domain-containing protein [Xanthomonadales bacterium]
WMSEGSRIDKWLWGARFFKTRSIARDAVAGGKVELNGHGIKPGRTLKLGDQLAIQRGEERFLVTVLDTEDRRVSAELAARRYEESEESIAQRIKNAEQRKIERESGISPTGRPDKRQRRQIISFTKRKT